MMPQLTRTLTDTVGSSADNADNADNRLNHQPSPDRTPNSGPNLPTADNADNADNPSLTKGKEEREGNPAESQSRRLIELASGVELFHSPDQKPYAHLRINAHHETYALDGHAFSLYLKKLYYDKFRGAPGDYAVKEAIGVLTAAAIFDGTTRPVSLRTAEHEGAFYVDLADAEWRAVVITERGWQVVATGAPRFWRTPHTAPLPIPAPGGSLADLRPFLNLAREDDFVLVVGFLLAALCPRGPYPILELYGDHGTAKSTATRIIRSLVDPNKSPLQGAPTNARDLMISAYNHWCPAFDNVSSIPPWLSDALCRLSTGGGFGARQLYSDADEFAFDAQRPVIINGIATGATRGDLLDRTVSIELVPIPDTSRRTERDLWYDFNLQYPRILGALLGALVVARRNLPTTKLVASPRMADFAHLLAAAAPALGVSPEQAVAALTANRQETAGRAIEADVVGSLICALMIDRRQWSGTASDLLVELRRFGVPAGARLPPTPNALGGQVRRLAPDLRRTAGLR